MRNFSYLNYRTMIRYIQKHLPIVSFNDARGVDTFCVIRHDVEYSPERALMLAEVESKIGIASTYCFQLRNNCYNVLSTQNLEIIRKIKSLGHNIGDHIHMGDCTSGAEELYILNDIQTLQSYSKVRIDGWSLHRPDGLLLSKYLEVFGNYINYNGKRFFQYFEGKSPKLDITYLADSNHQWKYGNPMELNLTEINKLQINCHPFSWSPEDLDNTDNFRILTSEKKDELIKSINSEIKNYPKALYEEEHNLLDWNRKSTTYR